ncbi:MAG: hypothetical protein REI12_09510 [Pedobacter sp.]|nr:hypothetical protein [Pedobacter sp.]
MRLFICALLVSYPLAGISEELPFLKGRSVPQCTEALQIARAVFKSTSGYLYEPPPVQEYGKSKIVLRPEGLDLSGGDALIVDPETFEKKQKADSTRSVYWQIHASHGRRLVVNESPVGWRGDLYRLYSIPGDVSFGEFLQETQGGEAQGKYDALEENWRPALVLASQPSGLLWALSVNQPFSVFGDWQVYIPSANGLNSACSISFLPQHQSPLLEPVRELVDLLSDTLGPGLSEGTLQPTARLRLDAANTWLNVQLRPWALSEPYNSRAEVDAGLLGWSKQGRSYQRLYQKIQRQLPLAEGALAHYYQSEMKMTKAKASATAAKAIDSAFRSNFTFSHEEG